MLCQQQRRQLDGGFELARGRRGLSWSRSSLSVSTWWLVVRWCGRVIPKPVGSGVRGGPSSTILVLRSCSSTCFAICSLSSFSTLSKSCGTIVATLLTSSSPSPSPSPNRHRNRPPSPSHRRRSLLHQHPQHTHLAFNRIMLRKHPFQRTHLVNVAREGGLRIAQLGLQVA